MKKLKLQMQLTLDGFVAGPNGELDWTTRDWDENLKDYVTELTDSVDSIVMGRKMADGFVSYWTNVKPDSEEYPFAKKMVDYPKIVFTKTLNDNNWINTRLTKGNISDEINNLKNQNGKDIIVYGGVSFVSSLIKNNLIDEYHFFINPTAIGKGLEIFNSLENKLKLRLIESNMFSCGIVANRYELS